MKRFDDDKRKNDARDGRGPQQHHREWPHGCSRRRAGHAMVFSLQVDDPDRFTCGRNCAAWLGLVSNAHANANKRRLGAITRAGNGDLGSLLVLGAATAIAARNPRILWALLKTGGTYRHRKSARKPTCCNLEGRLHDDGMRGMGHAF